MLGPTGVECVECFVLFQKRRLVNVHNLGHNLNTPIRLRKKYCNEIELKMVGQASPFTSCIFSCQTRCIFEAIHPGRG